MDDPLAGTPPALPDDVNFEIKDAGYEIWFSDRIANDHPNVVDEFGEWMEDVVRAVNLGQVDHKVLLADGVLTDALEDQVLAWWNERIDDLRQGE